MFEFTIPTANEPRSPRSLAASVAAHGLVVLLVFAIRFSPLSRFPAVPGHFTLIAPARRMPGAPRKMQVLRPRQFHPLPAVNTEALPTTLPAIEFLSPPLAEVPRVAVIVPAKVMPDATSPSPIPPPKPVIRASGFERADGPSVAPARTALPNLGSFESARTGETVPARGTIARSSGFSDGPAASSGTPRRNAVITAAFGDTTTERVAVASKQTAAARLTPVEILSKPRPAYTTEAREKHLEGEVLIEVHFTASGDARVVRVVRGLGSGLDETALAAARGIRFRPATRDGQPVDITALVHIVFQLAD